MILIETIKNNLTLRMWKLDLDTFQVVAYSNPSFATNLCHISQLGYIIMLCDKDENAWLLHYASYKSRRVAGSALRADTYAFADAYDFAYCAK